jgi:membrane-associated phospholipid phosphatase|tara:strand:- start:1130 stop:2539 length:1410 start_codon:yes stop_codon:yes gene_type:complete
MEWVFGPYETVMGTILLMTIPLQRLLTRDEKEMRVPISELFTEIREKGYKWHISIFVVMYGFKAFIDQHNEAIKPRVGGFTHYVHGFEGEFTLWVQETFRNGVLSDVLSFHYLFIYLFLIWFSPMYYILCRDEVMADKAVLNYFVAYVLAVPLYLFFNIEVTSSFLPGMDALMYHRSWNLFFFTEADPLDNGFPSLHVGIPLGLLIINRLHVRDLGIEMREWRHREFDLFVAANVPIYLFSIQYLGIHWISDVVPGAILAIICALFAHNIQPKLRSLRENGFSSLLPSREVAYTSAAFSLIGTLILLGVVVDGPGTDEDTPTMRVGPGDVNLDVVEVHSLWHPAEVGIRNVGDEDVEVLIIHRDAVERHAQDGVIDWASLSDGDVRLLEPGDSLDEQIETPSVYDGHFVLVTNQGDSGVGEVRVTIEYVDGSLLWSAIISSIPSFAITGLVIGWMYFSEDEVSEKIPNE